MSKFRVAIVLLMIGAAALVGYHAYQRKLLSPYAIGIARPGMRFRDMDDDAEREMQKRYACRAIDGGVQLCQLATDGPPGVLKAVVDQSGRIAILQFLISDSSAKTHKMGIQQTIEWNRVRPGDPASFRSDDNTNWEQMQTADSLWSAEMSWSRFTETPRMMIVTDERRLRRIAESSPAALRRLVDESLLDRHDMAIAASLAPVSDEAHQAAAEDADAVASSAASLPRCAPASAPAAVAEDTTSNGMEPRSSPLRRRRSRVATRECTSMRWGAGPRSPILPVLARRSCSGLTPAPWMVTSMRSR